MTKLKNRDLVIPSRLRNLLPAWAYRDHPIVARELTVLPPIRMGALRLLPGDISPLLVALLITLPCMCTFGSLPLHLLLAPMGVIPLIWAAPVVNREQTRQTWDLLRLTPYEAWEVVLAKWAAVVHHLKPLRRVLVAGQIASIALVLLLLSPPLRLGYPYLIGGVRLQPFLSGDPGELVVGIAIVALALTALLLDFWTNAALGVLASVLTRDRGMAYAAAATLRLILAVLSLMIGVPLAGWIADGPGLSLLLVGTAMAGAPGWTLLIAGINPTGSLLAALLLVLIQTLTLAALLGAIRWRSSAL